MELIFICYFEFCWFFCGGPKFGILFVINLSIVIKFFHRNCLNLFFLQSSFFLVIWFFFRVVEFLIRNLRIWLSCLSFIAEFACQRKANYYYYYCYSYSYFYWHYYYYYNYYYSNFYCCCYWYEYFHGFFVW